MKDFGKLVLEGNFVDAYKEIKQMKRKNIESDLINISYTNNNMLAYGFLVYALLEEESTKLHLIAAKLLGTSYTCFNGEELAYCHIKRVLEMDNTSFEALAEMMFLSSSPDTSGTKEDFEWAKKKIAELYPNDSILKLKYGEGMKPEDIKNSKMSEFLDD